MTTLTNSLAAVGLVSAAADRLIAANVGNAAALASANADLANADSTLASALQPVVDKLTAAAPAPVADTSGLTDGTVVTGADGIVA